MYPIKFGALALQRMGTWNWGLFDNDVAFDTVRQLAEGMFRMDQFRFECAGHPLDSERLQVLVALAAVIDGHVPAEEYAAARDFPFSFRDRRWVKAQVKAAVIPSSSELYDMWKDAGELEQWLAATKKVVH